jgi:hypothetical protein
MDPCDGAKTSAKAICDSAANTERGTRGKSPSGECQIASKLRADHRNEWFEAVIPPLPNCSTLSTAVVNN